jgi:zinc protease
MKSALIAFSVLSTFALTASALAPFSAHAIEVAFEEDHGLPVVYFNLAVKAGAAQDPAGQAGVGNFAGEMLLRGTRSKTKEQIDLALDQMGARLDVETRAEAIILRGAVLASQTERFLSLVHELVTQPSFPPAEIAKLKSEITSAILEEQGRDSSLGGNKFTHFLFNGHPYGNPILGTASQIKRLTREQIARQYERLFRDANLVVVGAGDATQAAMGAWATQLAQARPADPRYPALPAAPLPADAPHRRVQIVDKPERTQTQINFGQIGTRMTQPDFFPLYLGNYSFGGGSFSARLMVEVRVKRGWSYGANSYFRHGLQPRSWQVHLFPAEKDTPAALTLTLQMVEELGKNGITPAEFEFAQQSLVNSAGFTFNTPVKRVENKLLERTLNLPDGFMRSFGPEVQKLKLEQVNAALRNYLKPGSLAISVLGTAKNLRTPVAQATGLKPEEVEVTPYTAD